MRLTTFILLACVFSARAENVLSQSVKVSIDRASISLGELLGEIEQKSDYLFFYGGEIDRNRDVSVRADQKSVTEILDEVFEGTDIGYRQEGTHIILSRRATAASADPVPQNRITVTGTVTAAAGAVPGAYVVEAGTANGAIADGEGRFSVSVEAGATLVATCLGYVEQRVPVGNRTVVNITMAEDVLSMEEVVVVGYGSMKKVNLTGAVATLNGRELENRPITQATQALQGMQGVYVNQAGGQPGADGATIRIRGMGTLNNNDPLVLVDGIEYELNAINPNDIESISVLKNAASSAIYGSRAACSAEPTPTATRSGSPPRTRSTNA